MRSRSELQGSPRPARIRPGKDSRHFGPSGAGAPRILNTLGWSMAGLLNRATFASKSRDASQSDLMSWSAAT